MDRDKSGADDPGNRELIARYRQASAELNERPAASARASILAAAARNVDAKPVDAAAYRHTRPRWPLAAAATVMLSTLAVLLAIRTNEEMPQFGAPTEAPRGAADTPASVTAPRTADTPASVTAPGAADTPAAVTAPRATETPAPENARRAADSVEPSAQRAPAAPKVVAPPREREAMEQQVTEKRQAQTSQAQTSQAQTSQAQTSQAQTSSGRLMAPAKTESDSVAQAAREANRSLAETPASSPATTLEKARQNVPAAASPPPPAPEPADRSKLGAEQGAVGSVAPATPKDQAGAGARRDAARPAAPPSLAGAQEERKQVEESAEMWLERIIKLRREGRHDEAEAELKRFRERYPQVQPPAEALPPVGTR
jgi:hypothetical protein